MQPDESPDDKLIRRFRQNLSSKTTAFERHLDQRKKRFDKETQDALNTLYASTYEEAEDVAYNMQMKARVRQYCAAAIAKLHKKTKRVVGNTYGLEDHAQNHANTWIKLNE